MAAEAEWKQRIGARLAELRKLKGWSLAQLAKQTGDRLAKSRISNYEQGLRLVKPWEARILGDALGESPAHVMCLDDDMPALSKFEAKLIGDLRVLPESERAAYAERIAMLAAAYRTPLPEGRLMETGYNPSKRPKAPTTTKRAPGKHDN